MLYAYYNIKSIFFVFNNVTNLILRLVSNYYIKYHNMNYSFISQTQKVTERQPVYSNICPKCQSTKSYPLMNMRESPRCCLNCQTNFNPKISGYEEVIIIK